MIRAHAHRRTSARPYAAHPSVGYSVLCVCVCARACECMRSQAGEFSTCTIKRRIFVSIAFFMGNGVPACTNTIARSTCHRTDTHTRLYSCITLVCDVGCTGERGWKWDAGTTGGSSSGTDNDDGNENIESIKEKRKCDDIVQALSILSTLRLTTTTTIASERAVIVTREKKKKKTWNDLDRSSVQLRILLYEKLFEPTNTHTHKKVSSFFVFRRTQNGLVHAYA